MVVAEGGRVSIDAQKLEWVEHASDVGAYITEQVYQGKASRVDLEMTTSQAKSGSRAKGTKSHWSIIESLANLDADNAHYVRSYGRLACAWRSSRLPGGRESCRTTVAAGGCTPRNEGH